MGTVADLQRGRVSTQADLLAIRLMLVETLRSRPDDQQARMYLFQLLCIGHEWAHARAQLRVLEAQSPEARVLSVAYGQAIDAMLNREVALAERHTMPLHVAAEGWVRDFLEAPDMGRRTEALAAAPDTPGEVDGRAFERIFDGDLRFGPMIEAIVAGRWGLIPFAAIESIVSAGPVDLRDLVWLPAEIQLRHGPRLAGLLPATYPDAPEAGDAHRLARRTDWLDADGGVRGIGQRVWTLSDDTDVSLLDFRHLRFDTVA